MATEENKQLRWIMAIGLSLALHVLIVVLRVGVGGDDSPKAKAAPAPEPAPAKTQTALPKTEEPPKIDTSSSALAPKPYKTYVVKAGDNLSKIAKLDGSTLSELAELNDTDVKTLSRLQVGQTIKVRNGVE